MNYLRLLLFFFVLLAPLQLTSADPSDPCVNQYNECYDAAQPWAEAIAECNKKLTACWGRWSHFDDDNGDNHDDDHGDNHSDDDGNDHNQETPPRLLQDDFVWFQG